MSDDDRILKFYKVDATFSCTRTQDDDLRVAATVTVIPDDVRLPPATRECAMVIVGRTIPTRHRLNAIEVMIEQAEIEAVLSIETYGNEAFFTTNRGSSCKLVRKY